ncbi:hypothetical protein [Oceanobacillus iheyensis HTE831]|uniref:Uncharacterized protein n=1 Tax=Oceanobacillus iheyensis (strain DSM 14371 / CIP 107618 / JCM 11309 / KCTC 3954 / HTE831) TaxID=221109 RepID=Q8CV08_OCEIH|nr:hypothetical protein [Oceanobacillus iheyensis]BAC12905.1 hypothetical protein [Oceanobacillus iheyensis HTE831]
MNEKDIFTIDDYLAQLESQLPNDIPKSEKDSQLLEIKSHLEEIVNENEERNVNRQEAEKLAINEFISADMLANQINSEYKNNKNKDFDSDDFRFKGSMGFLFSGMGLLLVSVFRGAFELEMTLVGLIAIAAVLFGLSSKSIRWTSERVDYIKTISKNLLYIILPMGAVTFMIRSFLDGAVNFTAFFFFLCFMFIVFAIIFYLRRLFYQKKLNI